MIATWYIDVANDDITALTYMKRSAQGGDSEAA
jgi:hypothetical protein